MYGEKNYNKLYKSVRNMRQFLWTFLIPTAIKRNEKRRVAMSPLYKKMIFKAG